MPFGAAHTRTDDEVQANVACILYNNDLVEDDFELSKDNFLEVRSPNADGFFVDDRDSVELSPFVRERCMENCKEAWRSPTMRRF
jgi:cytochrome c